MRPNVVRAAAVLGGLVLLAGALPSAAQAAAPVASPLPQTRAAMQAALGQVLKADGATSVSVAVADRSGPVLTETAGTLAGPGTSVTPTTLYGMGSVSKMVVTTAVMRLVDAGKVSLDAPVTDYVPDFRMASPEYQQITVRMLLDHSAGLPGSSYGNAFTTEPFTGYADQVLAALAHERVKTTPGAMSVYCNDCFTLAGIVVARVSGQPYVDYATTHVLRPLGMTHSRFATTPLTAGSFARGVDADGSLAPVEVSNVYAAGGLMSTPSDMGRLGAMLANGGTFHGVRLLSKAAVQQMGTDQLHTTLTGPRSADLTYGLGWDTVTNATLAAAGVRGWTKNGGTLQYQTVFTVAPDSGLTVLVTQAGPTTASAAALGSLADQVLLTALQESGAIRTMPGPVRLASPAATRPSPRQLADVNGTYLASGAAYRLVAGRTGALTLSVLSDGHWAAQPGTFTLRTDGRYWSTKAPVSLALWRGWGRTYLTVRQPVPSGVAWAQGVVAQKVTATSPLSAAWSGRIGATWVPVTERPDSFVWQAGTMPTLSVDQTAGVPGYVGVTDMTGTWTPLDPTAGDDVAAMFLQIPIEPGRDQSDLQVAHRVDGDWARYGGALYRAVASLPTLVSTRSVRIDDAGDAEWLGVPKAGTVSISGTGQWKAFAADGTPEGSGVADGSPVPVTAGSMLVLFGSPGQTLTVTAN